MNPIKSKGVLCVLISLLVSAASSVDVEVKEVTEAADEDVAALKLRLHLLLNSYKEMCKQYSNLGPGCGAPAFNCTECPDDWLHVGDQCFRFDKERSNFTEAETKCEELGGHLAILTTREQHEAVEKEGRRIAGLYTHYWIGLTDAETEGQWKWVDKSALTTPDCPLSTPLLLANNTLSNAEPCQRLCEAVLKTQQSSEPNDNNNTAMFGRHWNTLKGEPDNNESGGKDGEDCAVVDSYTETWYDVPCDFSYPRICQKDAAVLP